MHTRMQLLAKSDRKQTKYTRNPTLCPPAWMLLIKNNFEFKNSHANVADMEMD